LRTRNVFLIVFLLAGQAASTGLPALAKVHPHAATMRVAPADEYFGRLKMSILGIRNQLHDLDARLQFSPEKSEDVIGSASMVEDALHDWEHKYPADPWLAKDVFQLMQMYSRIHTTHGRQVTAHTLHWLLQRYGKTTYASQAKTQLSALPK
jgi:hypothetical protein